MDGEQQLGQGPLENRLDASAEINKEPKLGLPKIDEFPEKVRPTIQGTFQKVETSTQIANALAETADHILVIRDQRIPNGVDQTKKLIEYPSDESKVLSDEHLAKVVAEVRILQAAYGKIAQGKDAPELRRANTPFDDKFTSTVQFTPEELVKFGADSPNPLHRVRQAMQALRPQTEDKKKFQEKTQKVFRDRVFALIRGALRESPLTYNHSVDGTLKELNKQLGEEPAVTGSEEIDTAFDKYFEGFKDKAVRLVANQQYLQGIEGFIEANLASLNAVDVYGIADSRVPNRLGDTLKNDLAYAKRLQDEQVRRFTTNLEGGATDGANQLLRLHLDEIHNHVKVINSVSEPIHIGWVPKEYQYASRSQDSVELSTQLKNTLESLKARVGEAHALDESVGLLALEEQKAKEQEDQNEALPTSHDLMLHLAPWDYMKQILERGVLASRKVQIDKFGSSNFLAASIKVGKEFVELPDSYGYPKRMTIAEFEKFQKTHASTFSKSSQQEAHQICFAKEGPHIGTIPQVALALSKASLLSKSQFMEADGWHLFDKEHNSDDPSASLGFEANLREEPVLIVVNSKKKAEFVEFVKGNLSQTDVWKNALADPDQWIEDNVVFINQEPNRDNPEMEFYSQDTHKVVKAKFFEKRNVEVDKGRFVPTGHTGHNPLGQPVPLWTYQAAA